MGMYPQKLIIEPTTRCNFKCEMCVKQSQGCQIKEGDLGLDVFESLAPLLPQVNTIIFTGIGEPLLYKGLESCLEMAKHKMPENSIQGFQTNGKLLTPNRAISLLKAGLNKICISVDATGPGLFDHVRQGGSFLDIETAFDALADAKARIPQAKLKTGIEFVLMKKNMDELPRVIKWAAQYGIDLILPEIRPKTQRHCPFVEDETMFVTWEGKVSPCYFLWHKYQVMRIGYTKSVTPVFFGNVLEQNPLDIWNSHEFIDFRNKVKAYDYPNCHAWCEIRCDYVLDEPFYQDCFINNIPCCDCHWNLGFLNCLT